VNMWSTPTIVEVVPRVDGWRRRELDKSLPEIADRLWLWVQVEINLEKYIAGAPVEWERYRIKKEIAKNLEQSVKDLRSQVDRYDRVFPHSSEERVVDRSTIEELAQKLRIGALHFSPLERLLGRLVLAWLGAGGKFSISTGPLAKFLSATTDYLPSEWDEHITEDAAKKFLGRFRYLVIKKETLRVEATFGADALIADAQIIENTDKHARYNAIADREALWELALTP
jgi:hypothetical protein